jgi:hypothetical protein
MRTFLQRARTEPQDVLHNGVKMTIVELSATLARTRHPKHHHNSDTIIQSGSGCSPRPYTGTRSRCGLSVSCSSTLSSHGEAGVDPPVHFMIVFIVCLSEPFVFRLAQVAHFKK